MKEGGFVKIKMLISIASVNWSYAPGEIAEFDDDTALKFIGNGFAESVEEKATKRGGKNADNSN
jgi:hypothetical protein